MWRSLTAIRRRVLMASIVLTSLGAAIESPRVAAQVASAEGSIKGQLADARGQAVHVGQAVVFLCDSATGMPISVKLRKPLASEADALFGPDDFWHVQTGDDGSFEFNDVPVGDYRLVAQAWSGISGMARLMPSSNRDDPGVEPSSVIILLGVAEAVEVEAGEAALAYPRQWGDGVLHITTDPEEPHNFVLLSQRPMLGDGVLGPVGWGRDFIAGLVGVTRMEDSHLTVIGVPDGAEVHVGLFNYDNSAGTGGATFVVGRDEPGRLPIYAGWSNGKYEPPLALRPLTDHLEKANLDVEKLVGLDKPAFSAAYLTQMWSRGAEEIDVPGFGKARKIDLVAADSFRQLRKHHRAMQELRNASQK